MVEVKVGEEVIPLFYFAISPFCGKAADVNLQQHLNVKSIGKLKTWPTQGAPHCFLTKDMWDLLKAYYAVGCVIIVERSI